MKNMEFNKNLLNEADIIISLANEIRNSIDVTFSQNSSKVEREDAYKVFEKTKYIEPKYDKVFSCLYRRNGFSNNIRVCSLHLFDQYIKTMWKEFSNVKKEQLKEEAISLIKECDFDEPLCLKEAAVKVIVEIIKRTWPQYWSSLLSDLYKLQEFGPAQLELVLIIFKRLFEDLNGSDDYLTSQRKKEMLSTLDSSIGMLFGFFLSSLNQYILLLNEQFSSMNSQIADAALDAILTFVTWVNLEHLFFQDKLLFKSLFLLLKFDCLKFKGCCCLQVIFERKGYNHQKLDLLSVMDTNDLNIIHEAARISNEVAIQNNEEYMFLKKLIETLSIFGRHIGDNSSNNQFEVELLNSYIRLMLHFSMHDSIMVSFAATKIWNLFLHHDVIKNNPVFIACIPDILECSYRNLVKISDPRLENSRSIFSKLDFEDIEDFLVAFADIHCSMIELSKGVTAFNPILALQVCESKIKIATSVPPPIANDLSAEKLSLTIHFMSWDSLSAFSRKGFANVFFKNPKNLDINSIAVCDGILKLLIEYNCEIPQIVSHVITTIEAFFPIFHYSQTNLLPVFNLIFAILGKSLDNPLIVKLKNVVSKAFNSLCQEIKVILIPYFNDLQVYFNLQFQQSVLTNYHKSLLLEGLLFVCAVLDNSVCKKEFVDNLFGFVYNVLKRNDIKSIFENPESLLTFLELDKPTLLTDEISSTHKEFGLALIIVLSVSRTLKVCSENEINDNAVEIDRSECCWIQHIINCIPYLFNFAKQYCLLWSLKDHITPSKSHYLGICDTEYSFHVKNNLGIDHEDDNHDSNKMQYYIYNLNEFTYTIVSHLATCVGLELYNLPGLSDLLIEKLAVPCSHLPNFRIKKVWKSFMRRFIICCPSNRLIILGPFLHTSLQMMLKRLSSEWERIEKRNLGYDQLNASMLQSNEINEAQKMEIIDEKVMSTLTKEFIDTLILYCTYKRDNKNRIIYDDSLSIGLIGDFLLSYEETNLTLIYIFFSSLTWPDSSSLVKICSVIMPIIKKTFALYGCINPEIPKQLLILLLTSLQKHGMEVHSEAALSNTIYHYYIHLRMQYPNLAEVLTQIPTCSPQQLQEFDSEVVNETKAKAKFRKLIKGACGKSVSRFYLNQHFYEELPPLARREKKENSIFYDNDSVELCTLFGDEDKK